MLHPELSILIVTEKESGRPPRPGRKKRDLKGKKLFENPETSSDEESPPSESEDAAEEDDDEDDNTPLFHVRQSTRKKRAPAPAAKVSQIDSTQATPAEITLSAEALEEEAFEEQTFRRGPLSPDDPLMTGSATEEQLPVMEFGGLNARTTAISGESDKVGIQAFFFVLFLVFPYFTFVKLIFL